MGNRREPGSLERAVLAVFAGAAAPMTVADVQRELPSAPAYTTVMTTLTRMSAKGALRQSREGRAYLYSPAAPADSIDDAVVARRMHRLLGDGADRVGVLARFVAELDGEEERLLAELLEKSMEG